MNARLPAQLPGWVALVLASALLLAVLALDLGDLSREAPVADGGDTAIPFARTAVARDLAELAGWSLFGLLEAPEAGSETSTSADAAPAAYADDATLLPPSSLDIKVQGIAYSRDADRAYAILEVEGGSANEYRLGQALKPGVTLQSVRPLEVVIDNNGQRESIALPTDSVPASDAAPSLMSEPPSRPAPGPVPPTFFGRDRPQRPSGDQWPPEESP